MSRLIPVHYGKFCKFLEYVGCEFIRKTGSLLVYRRNDLPRSIVVPEHKKLSMTVIFSNLKTLGISKEKYQEIMERIK